MLQQNFLSTLRIQIQIQLIRAKVQVCTFWKSSPWVLLHKCPFLRSTNNTSRFPKHFHIPHSCPVRLPPCCQMQVHYFSHCTWPLGWPLLWQDFGDITLFCFSSDCSDCYFSVSFAGSLSSNIISRDWREPGLSPCTSPLSLGDFI